MTIRQLLLMLLLLLCPLMVSAQTENNDETTTEQQDTTTAISFIDIPNAFSPNGDGVNDIYRVKTNYVGIVEFRATIFNRWGQKLYEWTDLDGGWDGTSGGKEVKQGTYFVVVKAKGSDGRTHVIRRDVNLLRGRLYGE